MANLAAKVEIKENEQFVSKTQSVSVAAFKPPPVSSSTDGEEKTAGDITASFQEGGKMGCSNFIDCNVVDIGSHVLISILLKDSWNGLNDKIIYALS